MANVNDRTFPKTPNGKSAPVMKGTAPTIPADAVKIEVPCSKTKMLARVELKGTPAVAKKLQEEFTLTAPDGIEIALRSLFLSSQTRSRSAARSSRMSIR